MISVYLLLDFCPLKKTASRQQRPYACRRIWEQTQPPLGRDATASGSRHDRLWEQTRPPLGRDANVSGAAFAEKQWVWSRRQSPSFAQICCMGEKKEMMSSVIT